MQPNYICVVDVPGKFFLQSPFGLHSACSKGNSFQCSLRDGSILKRINFLLAFRSQHEACGTEDISTSSSVTACLHSNHTCFVFGLAFIWSSYTLYTNAGCKILKVFKMKNSFTRLNLSRSGMHNFPAGYFPTQNSLSYSSL